MRRVTAIAIVLSWHIAVATPSAHAVMKCKAMMGKKDGLIRVSAKGAVGRLLWGGTTEEAGAPFFNEQRCSSAKQWRKCLLDDPTRAASKTPPAGCTLYLHDDATTCAAWITGCTPGLRELPVEPDLPPTVDLTGRVEALEGMATGNAEQIEGLSDTLSDHAGRVEALEGRAGDSAQIDALSGTVNDHTAQLDTLGETVADDVAALNSVKDQLEVFLQELRRTVDDHTAQLDTVGRQIPTIIGALEDHGNRIQGNSSRITGLEGTTACMTTDQTGDTYFEGCNVIIRNKTGRSHFTDGKGNLIIGWNERNGNPNAPEEDRSGSHNLVIGSEHEYAGSAGAVFGRGNSISGESATITGGISNTAKGFEVSVSGGFLNTADGQASSILGGQGNKTLGLRTTVVGGLNNRAATDGETHLGTEVRAGAVLGDEVRADAVTAGTVTILSDRNAKEDLASIDPDEVLAKVVDLPISQWQYVSQPSVRHVGPMAQDFHDAFGVGRNRETIATVDADGVALAAIQALHTQLVAQQTELRVLRAKLEALEQRQ